MKKLLVLLLSLVMALSLVACQSTPTVTPDDEPGDYSSDIAAVDIKLASTTDYVTYDSSELDSMDYVTTALATNHEINANFVDGLVENDTYGNIVPCVAESWEANDDATVWTFHLKHGINWVTSNDEVYAETTAEDFVTGLRHAAEFDSGTLSVVSPIIDGLAEYYTNGDYSDEAWAKVGVKALDDYTVVYTMNQPVTYFPSMALYAILFPVNKTFLESQGEGCVLGSPDPTACSFGTTDPSSIVYNGGYILDSFDVKSQTVLRKNENYWDAEHCYLETVTIIYDDGSDPYSGIRGFENGTYVAGPLNPSWNNFDEYTAKYDGYTSFSLANAYEFGLVFNFNRQVHELTNYATDETLAQNTHDAILNKNFRLALRYAWDRVAYLATRAYEPVAIATLRNFNGVPTLVSTSDGTPYGKLVEEAYERMTGESVDLSDGQDAWGTPNKAKAMEYVEAAKAEGIQFPIHLDMLVVETSDALVKQAQSMKDSIETNTEGNIIIELVLRDQDTVQNIAYYNLDPALSDYDISTFTGWGPDYADPSTFVDIYNPIDGYYMTSCGLTSVDNVADPADFDTDHDIKVQAGFYEYEALRQVAAAITDDLDARYEAYAEADAYLLAQALHLPNAQQTRSLRVTHVVPFTAQFSDSGICHYKYKGIQLKEGLVTTEEYEAALADFNAGGK